MSKVIDLEIPMEYKGNEFTILVEYEDEYCWNIKGIIAKPHTDLFNLLDDLSNSEREVRLNDRLTTKIDWEIDRMVRERGKSNE